MSKMLTRRALRLLETVWPNVVPVPGPLDTPSLEGLAYVLRRPELWPEGFVWNFGDANFCAMGLTIRLWGCTTSTPWGMADTLPPCTLVMSEMMPPLTEDDALRLFVTVDGGYKPRDIADGIDRYLAWQGTGRFTASQGAA